MPPPTSKPVTENRPFEWFRPDERELARHDDPEKTRLLGENMRANGQLQAVGATEDGGMIFGHGRWLAAKSAGIKNLEVKLYPVSLSETQVKLIRAAENLQRKDLTGHQKWLLCADLMVGNASWQMKDLAEHLHLDPSMVTRLLSPSKCIPAWQDALAAGTAGISDCYAASKLPQKDQAELLVQKLSGASRDQIEQSGRQKRSGTASAIRVVRIKCPLPSGATVTVSGSAEGLSLEEMIEALAELLKEARRANEQGIDGKTFAAVCRDKAARS